LLVEHSEHGQDILQAFVIGLLVNQIPADALRLLEKWQEAFPSDSKACYYTGLILTDYRKLPEAIAQFRNGLKLSPVDVEMHADLINALMENDMAKEAYALILDGKKRSPDETKFIFAEAQYFLAQQDLQRTRELAEQCIKIDPNNLKARLLLGRALFELEQYEQAVNELQVVVEREPANTLAREVIAKCMQRLGLKVAATQHFDFVNQSVRAQNDIHRLSRKLQDEPQNVELRFEIAQLAKKFVSPEDAAKWMHMVLEIQPDHSGALNGLVEYYDSIGETERGRELKNHIRVLKDTQ
jgi:tetratricopeptide (TPR) repeat protein